MSTAKVHAGEGFGFGAATLPIADADVFGHLIWSPPHGPLGQLAWCVTWAGMAMLPDLDMGGIKVKVKTRKVLRVPVPTGRPKLEVHGPTVARMWGYPTAALAWTVGKIARGHRWGTHDVILAPLFFAGLATVMTRNPVTALILQAFAIGLALCAMEWVVPGENEKVSWKNLVMSFGIAAALTYGGVVPWVGHWLGGGTPGWLPAAIWGGSLVHMIPGDVKTEKKLPVPFLWIVSKKHRWGLPKWLAIKTDRWFEKKLKWPVRFVGLFVFCCTWVGLAPVRAMVDLGWSPGERPTVTVNAPR